MAASTEVTVVVVSRNRKSEVLSTLCHHAAPVILVDNGSTDGTAHAVEERYPHVQVLRLGSNHGAVARNFGVELATTPYVAFADDDSWWEPEALTTAARILNQHPTAGLLAARILLGAANRDDPVCSLMADSPFMPGQDEPGKPILGFVACAAVVRRQAFLEAGGFDRVVFFAGEEARLALDLAAARWDLYYVPELIVHHHPSASRATPLERRTLTTRNSLLTATMRRPWSVVLRQTWLAIKSGPQGTRGVLTAVPRLHHALTTRRNLPRDLESRLHTLETWQTTHHQR